VTLDDDRLSWREVARLMEEEAAAARHADYLAECEMESAEAEEARWERIMLQAAAEREDVHYRDGADVRLFGP
jgi:hypothetical protein